MRLRGIDQALRFRNAFFLLFGVLLALIAMGICNPSMHVVRVVDEENHPLLIHPVDRGDRLIHQYRHSVVKCPIIEKFVVDKSYRIVLMESWNCNFGAGIATEPPPGAEQRLVDGFYVIENIRQVMPELYIHPVSFTDSRLTVGDQTWNLSHPPFEGRTIRMTIEPMTRWQYWVHAIQAA